MAAKTPASGSAHDQLVGEVPAGKDIDKLHNPKNAVSLASFLTGKGKQLDPNAIDVYKGGAPIHSIINSDRSDKFEVLYTLLVNAQIDVDLTGLDVDGRTALHCAVLMNDLECATLLVTFGANTSPLDMRGRTPLDLALIISNDRRLRYRQLKSWVQVSIEEQKPLPPDDGSMAQEEVPYQKVDSEMIHFMKSVGGKRSRVLRIEQESLKYHMDKFCPFNLELYNRGAQMRELYKNLEEEMQREAEKNLSLDSDHDIANQKQTREVSRFRKTGSRILCLDGGGLRGLIEIDLLHQLEVATGKKIVDLFDWIVGTSTGAVIALGLVYGGLTLPELRRLFFKLKDDVFSKPKFGYFFDTDTLEAILKGQLGSKVKMSDVKYPKLVISAVNKKSTPLQLDYFNNCFDDHLSNEEVWKVARCTSGGPILFEECNDYVDGGVLANNPTELGVAKIQNYHLQKGEKLPISLVVSFGTGVNPNKKLGSVDVAAGLLKVKGRVGNLMELLSSALGDPEITAETCKRSFNSQGIQYHRVSPELSEIISSSETDHKKLVDMILQTRQKTLREISEIVACLVPSASESVSGRSTPIPP